MSLLSVCHFDGIHEGHRGFVIGGGPSISSIDSKIIDRLKQNEVTIGANLAYKLFVPNYLCFVDGNFVTLFKKNFKDLPCIKISKKKFEDVHHSIYGLEVDWENYSIGKYPVPRSFSYPFSFPNSGAFSTMVAYVLGCNPIYLIGVDLKVENDKTHFHDFYHKKAMDRLIRNGVYERMYDAFVPVLTSINERGVKVYTTTPGTILDGIIEYVNLRSLFL